MIIHVCRLITSDFSLNLQEPLRFDFMVSEVIAIQVIHCLLSTYF